MTTTPDLGIPELAQSQALPEVTHNEALMLLQALLNGVVDATTTAPPGAPTEGDAYIVGASATGAWSGYDDHVAVYYNGGWRFVPGVDDSGTIITMDGRQEGMRVYNRATEEYLIWSGSPLSWSAFGGSVDSVFGRTGAVVAAASDYDANQVDYNNGTSGLTATDVQAAIDEIVANIDSVDWIEEGVWTPTVTFATPGDFTPTYSIQKGSYHTKGNWVFVQCVVQFSTNAYTTAAGGIVLGGLPFAPVADVTGGISDFYALGQAFMSNGTYTASVIDMLALVSISAGVIQLYQTRSGTGAAQATVANFPASTSNISLRFAGFYKASIV